jgi:hypothetical protein
MPASDRTMKMAKFYFTNRLIDKPKNVVFLRRWYGGRGWIGRHWDWGFDLEVLIQR